MTTKEEIVEVACELYTDVGFSGFSLREVAGKVGLSPTAIYRHFDSKEALLMEVVKTGYQLFQEKMNLQEIASCTSFLEKFQVASARYRDFALEDGMYYEIIFLATDSITGLKKLIHDAYTKVWLIFDEFQNMIEEHEEELQVLPSEEILRGIWAYAYGLVGMYLTEKLAMNEEQFRTYFDQAMQRYLLGVQR